MTYRPSLRSDLVRVPSEDDPAAAPIALFDPVIGRRVQLGPIARVMYAVLDGHRSADEVLAEVERAMPTRTRAEIEATLRSMLLLLCLEGVGTEVLRQAQAIRFEGQRLKPVFLEETRVACQGSGDCCQVYAFGPLTEQDIARLEGLDIAGQLPEAGPGPWLEDHESTPGTPSGKYLKSVKGRCVFLAADRKCGIHAKFGALAKPGLCRIYPLRGLPTIQGNRIHDRGECSSFVASALQGKLLSEDLGRVGPLLPTTYIYHPIAFLDARTPCDYSYVLAFADTLVALAGGARDIGAVLRASARLLTRWTAALASSPLVPGAAEAISAAELARASDVLAGHEPVSPEDYATLARVTSEIVDTAAPVLETRLAEEPGRVTTRFASAFVEAGTAMRARAASLANPAGAPLDDYTAAIFRVTADEAWVHDALRSSLRQRFYGSLLLEESRIHSGLAAAAVVVALAMTAARARAHLRGRKQLLPEDLSFGHAMATQGLRDVEAIKVLIAHDAEGAAITRAASGLL